MKMSEDKLNEIIDKIIEIFKEEELSLYEGYEVVFNIAANSGLAAKVSKERFLMLLIRLNNHYIERFNQLMREENDNQE